MNDPWLRYVELLTEAFERKLGRGLTAEELQDLRNVGSGMMLEVIERDLERASDAAGAAAVLASLRNLYGD